MDGSIESMQALATATTDYRQAVVQTLVAIKQISVQVEAMFDGDARQPGRCSGLTRPQLYDRYRPDADAAMPSCSTTTDPAQIEKLSQRINDDINAAFNALDDTGKTAQQKPAARLSRQHLGHRPGRLLAAGGLVAAGTVDPFAAANAALDGAAARFAAASETNAKASNVMLRRHKSFATRPIKACRRPRRQCARTSSRTKSVADVTGAKTMTVFPLVVRASLGIAWSGFALLVAARRLGACRDARQVGYSFPPRRVR